MTPNLIFLDNYSYQILYIFCIQIYHSNIPEHSSSNVFKRLLKTPKYWKSTFEMIFHLYFDIMFLVIVGYYPSVRAGKNSY